MKNPNFPAGVKPAISATITQEDGKTIELTDKNFMAGSVSFKSGTSDSNTFTVGGAIIGAMSFSLLNRDGTASAINYVNATIEATLSYGGQSVDMGKFWFVNHEGGGDVVKCDAYDGLQLFDEHQLYEDNITYPTTIQDLANKIVTGRGFTLVGLTGANIAIDNPNNDDMTERECLSRLAQMMGMYVVARGMTIVFGRYDESTAYDAGTSFSHQLRTEPITITDVVVNVQNSNTEQPETFATSGDGYVITIDDNPFVTDANKAQVQAMLDQHIKGLSFHPGTYSIKANPAIDVGDCINIQTRDAKYKAYVTNSTYKLTLQQSISADADNYVGDRRVSKKPKIQQAINNAAKNAASEQIKNDLNDPNSDLSQAIQNGGGGSSWGSKYAPMAMLNITEAIIAYDENLRPSSDWSNGYIGGDVGIHLHRAGMQNDSEEEGSDGLYTVVSMIKLRPFSVFIPNPDFIRKLTGGSSVTTKGIVVSCSDLAYARRPPSSEAGVIYPTAYKWLYTAFANIDVTADVSKDGTTTVDIKINELSGSCYDDGTWSDGTGGPFLGPTADFKRGIYVITNSNYPNSAYGHIITGKKGCSLIHEWVNVQK